MGYVLMVTADHGNAEQMLSEEGGPHTAHTTNRGAVHVHVQLCFLKQIVVEGCGD